MIIRTLAAAGIAAAALALSAPAQAAPALCAEHPDRYITACAGSTGGGGGDPFALNRSIKGWNSTPSHPNHGQYNHVESD